MHGILQKWDTLPEDLREHWADELEWMAGVLPRYRSNRDIWRAAKALLRLARNSKHPALKAWVYLRGHSHYSGALDRQTPLCRRVGARRGHLLPKGALWAWTDYPLLRSEVGTGPAPIRRVRVLSWDGNKYAKIRWGQQEFTLKVGYLYTAPGRVTEVDPIDPDLVPIRRGVV